MNESSAFLLLEKQAERARLAASELPPVQATQTHWAGLGFNLVGQRFVAPIDEVGELMRVPQTTRIPGVKSFVLGVGNVRGRLMTVVDLAMLFDMASELPRAQRRVLAVESEETFVGFVIDDSLGMQHFPSDAFTGDVSEVPKVLAAYTNGAFKVAGISWPVISLAAILADRRLNKLAITH